MNKTLTKKEQGTNMSGMKRLLWRMGEEMKERLRKQELYKGKRYLQGKINK